MKKINCNRVYFVLVIFTFLQCTPTRKKTPLKADNKPVRALHIQLRDKKDTLGKAIAMKDLVDKTEEKSSRVDGVFNDFIYQFACVDSFQRERILFPLSYKILKNKKKKMMEAEEWKHDSLFFGRKSYCLMMKNEVEATLWNDSIANNMSVIHISLNDLEQKKYTFERHPQRWMLTSIQEERPRLKRLDASFRCFYKRFATDSIFQLNHVASSLIYLTDNPEDEFSIVEGVLSRQQFMTFRPNLPHQDLIYLQSTSCTIAKTQERIIVLRNADEYLFCTLYFRLKKNQWELYKYEDIIN
jgi:hypothetical protein